MPKEPAQLAAARWFHPDETLSQRIKVGLSGREVTIIVEGWVTGGIAIVSCGYVRIHLSSDPVCAALLYRDVR